MNKEVEDNDFGLTKLVAEAKEREVEERMRKDNSRVRLKALRAWNDKVSAKGKVAREHTLSFLTHEPMSVSELASLVGISPQSTRGHLNMLIKTGQVELCGPACPRTYKVK